MAELGQTQYPLLMRIEKRAITFWKHLKMSDPNSYNFKALNKKSLEQSPLIQMILMLQTQTNMTNNIHHQDTETSIYKT